MNIQTYLERLGLPPTGFPVETLLLGGMAMLLLGAVLALVLVLGALRGLRRRLDAQSRQIEAQIEAQIGARIDALGTEALARAPARAAAAALVAARRDERQSLDRVEAQLFELMQDWDEVVRLGDAAHDMLAAARVRPNGADPDAGAGAGAGDAGAGVGAGMDSAPARHKA